EAEFEIKNKTEAYDKTQESLGYSKGELETKKKELNTITSETQIEEEALLSNADAASKKIEDRLLKVYNKLRGSFRNGLAVVSIEIDSCSGCLNKITQQLQSEIRQRKKMIHSEHCGRVLVDEMIASEEG